MGGARVSLTKNGCTKPSWEELDFDGGVKSILPRRAVFSVGRMAMSGDLLIVLVDSPMQP
jgi:hypothetical protein